MNLNDPKYVEERRKRIANTAKLLREFATENCPPQVAEEVNNLLSDIPDEDDKKPTDN